MTTAEILARAADLIEPEGAWCQETSARNAEGRRISFMAEGATSFCLLGAVSRITRSVYPEGVLEFVRRVVPDDWTLSGWNDAPGRTQQEVVAALRLASARAKEEK